MVQFRAESVERGTKITLTTRWVLTEMQRVVDAHAHGIPVRTSGTEPKIKYYLEGSGKDAAAVADLLPKVVQELSDVWMEAGKNGLGRP